MSLTPNLVMPLVAPEQAQKHVPMNEALTQLDALVQLSVLTAALSAPPGSPVEGNRYIVAAAPTGAWAGQAKAVALWSGGAWLFFPPAEGWIAWNQATGAALVYQSAAWAALSAGGGGGSVFSDSAFFLQDNGDATKQLQFQLSGITTGTIRTLTVPDANGTLPLLAANQTFSGTNTFSGTSVSVGTSVAAATYNLGSGANTSGVTKTVNVATAGLSGSTSDVNIGSAVAGALGTVTLNAPTVTMPGTSLSLGTSVAAATYNLGAGVTGSGVTKAINIGTLGASGSTTNITLGSGVAGAGGTLSINSPTVTFGASVTAVGMAAANLSALWVGIGGATATTTNRLSVTSPAVLLNNAGASMDLVVNKQAIADSATLSFDYQLSGRMMMGLIGNNNTSLRVSSDGSTWYDAVLIDRTNGRTSLLQGAILGPLASDPGAPDNGQAWYNSTTGQLKMRLNGLVQVIDPGQIPAQTPGTGDYVMTITGGVSGALGTQIGVADRMDLHPFIPRTDLTIDRLSINCTTAVASSLVKIILYASDVNGKPTTLITETATLDTSTTGVKEATVSLTLLKGVTYWIGLRHNSTATLTMWGSASTPELTANGITVNPRKLLRRTLAFATAAPGTWGYAVSEVTNATTALANAIWLRSA